MTKRIITALAFIGLLLSANALQAQLKIGYTNTEIVVSLMPEAQGIQKQLATYEQKLSEKLNVKQSYMETKLQEYRDMMERGELSDADRQTREQEIQKLQKEIQDSYSDAENDLMEKRQQMLGPVLEKVQGAIDKVAEENGYTYIFNANSSGAANILYGPEQDNITEKVLVELGIDVEKLKQAQQGAVGVEAPAGGTPAVAPGN